ncbi:hypothetical protein [Fodinicola feengrottensis]|uniref:hypothetical protein n=1 Tax=Fodinicola feengrottensis TaxID=435914 RepID=UPI00244193C9|nr:hypothetical protein [Fodinicola feengrottensis]
MSLVDLLAAIPSLLYGLWGYLFLEPKILPLSQWLSENVSWLPIFKVTNDNFLGSYFTAGVVVSLMVLPITTSVAREAFSQAPQSEKEAAFALGSTLSGGWSARSYCRSARVVSSVGACWVLAVRWAKPWRSR